jgi:hypothetical protein
MLPTKKRNKIFLAVFCKFIFIFLNPENGYKVFVTATIFHKHYYSAKIFLIADNFGTLLMTHILVSRKRTLNVSVHAVPLFIIGLRS